MSTRELSELLGNLLNEAGECQDGDDLAIDEVDAEGALYGCQVRSFEEAGVLTANDGFVIRLDDRSEFQVTIVRSR